MVKDAVCLVWRKATSRICNLEELAYFIHSWLKNTLKTFPALQHLYDSFKFKRNFYKRKINVTIYDDYIDYDDKDDVKDDGDADHGNDYDDDDTHIFDSISLFSTRDTIKYNLIHFYFFVEETHLYTQTHSLAEVSIHIHIRRL